MRVHWFLLGILFVVAPVRGAGEAVFRAGAVAIDITPEKLPVIVNGMFEERTAAKVNDPLYARALVLDDSTTRIAIVVVDSCMLPRELLDEAKALAAKGTGILTDRMLISATHTHSAPAAMGCLGSDADVEYQKFLAPKLARAIEAAAKRLVPARIGWGVIDDAEHTHVRRYVRRPDRMLKDPFGELTVRANMHPGYRLGNGDAVGPSGPEDPRLSVVSVQAREGGKPVAVLANYSMHYFSSPMLSADYFGQFVAKFGEMIRADASFVGLMSQGTSGDLWLADYEQERRKEMSLAQYSEEIARVAHRVYERIEYRDWVPLGMKEAKLTLRRRVPDERRLSWAKQVVASLEGRKPKVQSEIYAREQILLHEEPERELKLQAIRIGDVGITAIPNEVYALTGLKLKAMSPLGMTFNISLANGSEGYIPPPEQHKLGGYTTWAARTAGLEEEAEPKIVEGVVKLLEAVSGKQRRVVRETHGGYALSLFEGKPLGYWRMEEMGGRVAVDSTGQGLDGVYSDGVVFYLEGPASGRFCGQGIVNRAAHFAGGRMRVDLPRLENTYTVEMWFWNGLSPDARETTGYLFSRGRNADAEAMGDHLGIGGTAQAKGRLVFFNGNRSNTIIPGKTEIQPRTWNHVAMVRRGDRVNVYLNGKEEAGGVAEVTVPRGTGELFFGGRNDNFANWEGKIDEVAVYSRALSAKEIAERFAGAGVEAPRPVTPATAVETPAEGAGDGADSSEERSSRRDSDPKSPAESLGAMHVKEGYEVELVACEPLVVDPVAIEWGMDGKLWVVEMADYPMGMDGKMKPGGRVKFLEDEDGDGKYEKATVFLDGLNFPNGILVWRKGAIVTAAPEIFYAEDTDGDGRADKRETLYRGFKEGNLQLRVNGLRLGLDGWVYCANGWSGGVAVSEKTGAKVDLSGRDLRIKPDTGEVEAIAGVSQFGRNQDDWGNWFGTDNSHPLFHYVLDDRYIRRNPYVAGPDAKRQLLTPANPKVFPRSRGQKRFHSFEHAGHFTSACSGQVYRDGLLFGRSDGTHAFVCEPVHNLVQHVVLREDGVSFVAGRAADEADFDFLASEDPWFRPVMSRTGPDGALWVVDMYRYMIEHPHWLSEEGQKELLPVYREGDDKGRIYRVYPKGKRPGVPPRLDRMEAGQLALVLEHPNGWVRDMAQQMLVWRGGAAAIEAVQGLLHASASPVARVHALCALEQMKGLRHGDLERALGDEHEGVRRWGVRLSEGRATLLDAMAALVRDQDAKVRQQLAYSLGESKSERAGRALGELAVGGMDDPYVMAAVMGSATGHYAAIVDAVLRQSERTVPASVRQDLLAMALANDDRGTMAGLLEGVMTAKDGAYTPGQLEAFGRFLDLLAMKRRSVGRLMEVEDELTGQLKQAALIIDAARRVVASSKATEGELRAAVPLLGRSGTDAKGDLPVLAGLLAPRVPTDVQLAVVKAMMRSGDVGAAELLTRGWGSHSPGVRSAIVDQLLNREAWALHLMAEVEGKRISRNDIDVTRRERLLRHKSPRVKAVAEKLFGSEGDATRREVVEQNRGVLAMSADARRGAKVFAVHCATCHRVEGVGQDVGPNLAAVRSWSGEALLTAMLDPDRQVEPRYVAYNATLNDEEIIFGIITAETGNSISMKGLDGQERAVLRGNLKAIASTGRSLMPVGFEEGMTRQEMADLIAFLQSPLTAN